MDYTIKKVADLSGVSTRTLRYYDEINLLKPAKINTSGYRIYGTKEINKLQQILFYRSLNFTLQTIQVLLNDPDFSAINALEQHHQKLLEKRERIDLLISTVEKTIHYQKGELDMSNSEKFIGLKKAKVKENEEKYGKEIRAKYGDNVIDTANKKWLNMTENQMEQLEYAEKRLFELLPIVIKTQDISSPEAKELFAKHKEWLEISAHEYSKQYHRNLAQMYRLDERFADYYNQRAGEKAAETLCNIIEYYTE